MLSTTMNPAQILESYRKSDAVLIVCQNNATKTVEIAAINAEASRITGYTNEEVVSKPLSMILPDRLNSTIDEFVEYGDDKNDLLMVLNKIRTFSIKARDGHEANFKLRIIRGEAIDRNPWFHLVLIDEEELRKSNAFRHMLRENFKGHEVIDARSNLPNRASLLKDLELVVYHVRNSQISASLAVIDINGYESFLKTRGQADCDKILQHIGNVCKQKLRPEDTVGALSDRTLGLVLVDAQQEPARMVLNRLRWAISVSPLQLPSEDLLVQVNIAFAQIDGKISEQEALEKCEQFATTLRGQTYNSIQLVVTHERRAQEDDRRKEAMPVPTERRKKQRRKKRMG